MNLVLAILLPYVAGLLCAFAGRAELRGTPRASLTTEAFRAFAAHMVLVMVPSTLYFYLFHGDWFLLYLVDADRIPSALAMLFFFVETGLGALGFAFGAQLVRAQREALVFVFALLALALGGGVLAVAKPRFVTSGTFAQFHGQFGLAPWTETSILPGLVLVQALMLVGLVQCLVRTQLAARRATAG